MFLIICVKDRKQLLGKIVGCGDLDTSQMTLSEYGQNLDKLSINEQNMLLLRINKYVFYND